MPGWYIHMDVARKSLAHLPTNVGAAPIFGAGGPTAADITGIAQRNPAYVALGAIGPDIFFLLPDFKPPQGTMLWGAANTVRHLYTWWDDNFMGPYEDQLGPIADNAADELGALTGGLAKALSDIMSKAFHFLLDTVAVMVVRQYDVFSFLGSGVPEGYDEQAFFWSDMLHYRKTYEFAAHLWQTATAAGNERQQAFALGWMSHLATDVAGHCFVNEKSGGPYRLHWQRHHLVENHMDAKVYDSEHGVDAIYQMISSAALHLWIAFNHDGSSRLDFFQNQPGPSYDPGDKTPAILDRKSKWDVDSAIPRDLAQFLADALLEVYNKRFTQSDTNLGQCAPHPTIIADLKPGSVGYPDADDIATTYWWLYHYVKFTTTDYFTLRRPDPPELFDIPPFPSPPGTGESDPGPGEDDKGAWHDFLEILFAIFGWIAWLAEVAAWPVAALAGIIVGAGTKNIRDVLYENVELPLYNAWMALHWYLAMTGFVSPMQQEISPGLNTLGVGVEDVWETLQTALSDLDGGLVAPVVGTEPSGSGRQEGRYPHDVISDPPGFIANAIHQALDNVCGSSEAPSEFLRPWLWPEKDNQGDTVPQERPGPLASPYTLMQDATVLMAGMPGDKTAREDFEGAQNEAQTIQFGQHLGQGQTLGDPVDYTGYLVARLTRTAPASIANFNLDSDRGYAYLCWDWVRSEILLAGPAAFNSEVDKRLYHAPLRPGAGWCDQELVAGQILPPPGSPGRPAIHDPSSPTATPPVRIRYIDREVRFE